MSEGKMGPGRDCNYSFTVWLNYHQWLSEGKMGPGRDCNWNERREYRAGAGVGREDGAR